MQMEKAGKIEEVVDNVSAMNNVHRIMAEHILKAGQELADNKFKITPRKELESLKDGRDYPVLRPNDTDIVLKVDVNCLEFMGEKGKDPDSTFAMKGDIKVIGAKSGKESYPGYFAYVSEERKFYDWTANNAQLLQSEFKHCYQTLSERIIKKIFLSSEQYIADLLLPEPQTVQFEIEKKQLTHVPSYHENVGRANDNVETIMTDTDSQKSGEKKSVPIFEATATIAQEVAAIPSWVSITMGSGQFAQ